MNKLRRSTSNKYIGGVCGGLAEWTDTSPLAWRIIFLLIPSSLIIYIVAWMLIKKQIMKDKFDIDRKLSILIGLWILDKLIILAMFYWFDYK